MKKIEPNEIEIKGAWIFSNGKLVEDVNCLRIRELIQLYLLRLGADSSGWDVLYRDTNDGRLWELRYPQSDLQGGGPPQLNYISDDDAKMKYVNVDGGLK